MGSTNPVAAESRVRQRAGCQEPAIPVMKTFHALSVHCLHLGKRKGAFYSPIPCCTQ